VAQRLKRQLIQARSQRERAFEECNRALRERDHLLVVAAAYEAILGTLLSAGDGDS
jgi:hypothetical protein